MIKEWRYQYGTTDKVLRAHIASLTRRAWDERGAYRRAKASYNPFSHNPFGSAYHGARYSLMRDEIRTLREIVLEGVAA